MRKVLAVFVLTACFSACKKRKYIPRETNPAVLAAAEGPPRINMTDLLETAVELREAHTYEVELEMRKDEAFSFNIENKLKAQHRTVTVGENAYNSWPIGHVISKVRDGLSLTDSYIVTVRKKTKTSRYLYATADGAVHEINIVDYEEAVRQFAERGRALVQVPYAGLVRTYVFREPLAQIEFEEMERPLTRYFVTIEIQNDTTWGGLWKSIRNAMNTHRFELEVPREIYEQNGAAFDTRISDSWWLTGNLSQLSGTIVNRRTADDPNFVVRTTKDGREVVLPAN